MTFLQPLLLAALPLIALPIVIHLINQWRYQSIHWGAMKFLLAANRMSRGYARLRQWLILLFRMLVIAALIFAVSRPLASGWLGVAAGGGADTTIILLDRSPSMQQQEPGTIESKLNTGKRQLVQALSMFGSSRWVLIENAVAPPREFESLPALLKMPEAEPCGASADLPALLRSAFDYIQTNRPGRAEVWICSDVRHNDWNPDNARWRVLRESFHQFPQHVRFHLLAYPGEAAGNLAVRVTQATRRGDGDGAELLVSLRLTREGNAEANVQVPIRFEIDGARSEITVEMTGSQLDLRDHRIPLNHGRERGWGQVSIPADLNPADNDFYFVFDQPAPRHAVVVTEDPQLIRPLELAASIAPEPNIQCSVEVLERQQLSLVEWERTALLLWHASLPKTAEAESIQAFVERGGQVVFFPPREPDGTEFLGSRWQSWVRKAENVPIETWRSDQDLLANTLAGGALPVGQLQVLRYCELSGDMTPLAALRGNAPLLARLPTPQGGVYFCATTTAASDSSLATDGTVLYVMVQRALTAGSAVLGTARQLTAGEIRTGDSMSWNRIAGPAQALSTELNRHPGVYGSEDELLAINRSANEDNASVVAPAQIKNLFEGLDFVRVDDEAGSLAGLIREIWRMFLISMMLAMIVEAVLCLPKSYRAPSSERLPAH